MGTPWGAPLGFPRLRGFSVRSLRNPVVEDERGRGLFPMGLHLCRFTRTQCGGAFAFFSGVTAKQMPEKATTVICVPKRAEQSGRNFEIDHDVRLRVSRAPKRVLHFSCTSFLHCQWDTPSGALSSVFSS